MATLCILLSLQVHYIRVMIFTGFVTLPWFYFMCFVIMVLLFMCFVKMVLVLHVFCYHGFILCVLLSWLYFMCFVTMVLLYGFVVMVLLILWSKIIEYFS